MTSSSGRVVPATRTPVRLFSHAEEVAKYAAHEVAELIRQRNLAQQPTVLGLPTGSTPIGVYRELIRLHREEGLDFSRVITFNLDEYYPMLPDNLHSYHRWMHENFFAHVNIPSEQIHIPRGDLPPQDVDAFCRAYEQKIRDSGGIDLQLLGIGRTGHIGFNEPGSGEESRTRKVHLDPVTRKDAASGFYGEDNVPLHAVTMGVASIMDARRIIILALGEHKAGIIREAVENDPCPGVVASFLQQHPQTEYVVDRAAADALTAIRTPWICGSVDWTPQTEKQAVIWLSQQTGKSIHRLELHDFMEHHLVELLHESGPIENIRQRVFDSLAETICLTPGGKQRQRVLVFSPHPDDDVISMGGTLITLTEQGHDVHVAYMTSGNIAVFDHDAVRHIDFVSAYLEMFGTTSPELVLLEQRLRQAIAHKPGGEPDDADVLKVKGLIRKTEAIVAAETAGVPEAKCHFLDMPFYQTGVVKKNPIGPRDVEIVKQLFEELQPQQVYLAGDLSDPHGTHRMCAQAIIAALQEATFTEGAPDTWLYRGAWQEYPPHEIERAVPLSPEVVIRKRKAIYKHESQKDAALFPGHDEREFWVRAEHRTHNTARLFKELGLPEYFAIESFRRLHGDL